MPLSTVCVSTVSTRPRAWSSFSNIRAKDVRGLSSMNSAEEISKYREPEDNYYSPTLSRRLLGYGYELPEKSPKKEKKWSIGSLFRRKKREESESSSGEDVQKKGFLNRRKRKSDKKKKSLKPVGTFDHVVISRNSHLYSNGHDGILSDPSGGFDNYHGRVSHLKIQDNRKPILNSKESLEEGHNSRTSLGSADSLTRKNRKGLAKVRAEARRHNLKHESSSDEDSQRSVSSSRFKSDESLGALQREGSMSRRSRAARTERYLRRHSKDGENPKDYLRLSKSDAENSALQWKTSDDSNRSLSRSPLVPKLKPKTSFSSLSSQSPSISGLSTIPPSHGSHSKVRVSNSTSNPSYKPPLSMNEYNYSTRKLPNDYCSNQRSLSCDANIHKARSSEVIQFPIGKVPQGLRMFKLVDPRTVSSAKMRQPPPPPPRDPKRMITAQYYENGRPNTYYFDNCNQIRSKSFHNSSSPLSFVQLPTKKLSSFNCRSTSEDHLPKSSIQLVPRPSSATPEAAVSQRFITRHPDLKSNPENYNYLTDKKPRSRKPIFIQTNNKTVDNPAVDRSGTQKALDFWKRKDKEGAHRFPERKVTNKSPQMFTSQTHVQTQVFLPSVLQNDINSDNLANSTSDLIMDEPVRTTSTFKPISSNQQSEPSRLVAEETSDADLRRKSSNLEEALDELEAIYNSLRLGDEDLLERAEQREKDAAAQKLKDRGDIYPNWAMSRGALSDSSFSYEPFDTVDSPRRKRLLKKSQTIDRRGDDMAFRKMNKERAATINDPQSVIAKLSYLQTSPLFANEGSNDFDVSNKKSKEPDVTLDDVVYRNVKYANSSPKVVEPQPPFGIPVGPIAPAPNSDYLHAVPDNIHRPSFKPRRIPDLVKDDLAFRNLRKDQSKEPALPPASPDDLKNNNAVEVRLDLNSFKKKRAVRSLSANIGSLINKDILVKGLEKHKNSNVENEFKTLTDIADAMEIARQVLKEKENKITATRRAFLSDTDTNNGNCEDLSEVRMNYLNNLRAPAPSNDHYLHAKPPRGLTPDRKSPRSPKESTPIPVSPLEEKLNRNESRNSSLEELLTALATEARETSDRITSELKQFGEDTQIKGPRVDENLNKKLSEIDAVSEQAKLCEKLLEGVVDSTDLMTSAPTEVVEQIEVEPVQVKSVANIILTRDDLKLKKPQRDVHCESDHDYENLMSDKELNLDEVHSGDENKCTSPFEEHKAQLIASFQELKKNVDHDLNGSKDKAVAGEDRVDVVAACASNTRECACVDLLFNVPNSPSASNSPTNSSSQFSSCHYNTNLDSLDSLKSPKLVLETSKLSQSDSNKQILRNQSMICRDLANKPGTSSSDTSNESGHVFDDDDRKPTAAWYRDPTTVAVACSYGFACVHQLASLDFVAILGILFAVLSFIAALII